MPRGGCRWKTDTTGTGMGVFIYNTLLNQIYYYTYFTALILKRNFCFIYDKFYLGPKWHIPAMQPFVCDGI